MLKPTTKDCNADENEFFYFKSKSLQCLGLARMEVKLAECGERDAEKTKAGSSPANAAAAACHCSPQLTASTTNFSTTRCSAAHYCSLALSSTLSFLRRLDQATARSSALCASAVDCCTPSLDVDLPPHFCCAWLSWLLLPVGKFYTLFSFRSYTSSAHTTPTPRSSHYASAAGRTAAPADGRDAPPPGEAAASDSTAARPRAFRWLGDAAVRAQRSGRATATRPTQS